MNNVIRLELASSLVLALALAACGSESGQPLTDGGGSGDAVSGADGSGNRSDGSGTGSDSGPVDGGAATPIMGGGAGGGPLQGHLIVFVLDHASKAPIQGAVVEVEAATNPHMGTTGADGRVDIGGTDLVGPTTVHVFASGYPFQTTVGVNAAILTYELSKGTAQMPNVGTVSGNVLGWDLLPAPTSTSSFRFGDILGINKKLLGGGANIMQDLRSNQPIPTNLAISPGTTDYALKVDTDATSGVFIIGGILTLHGVHSPTTQITNMGFLPGLMVMPNVVLSAQNITFTHPLNQNVSIMFTDAPDLPNKSVVLEIQLPQMGGYAAVAVAAASRTGTASAMAPALTGALSGGSYVLAGIVKDSANQQSIAISRGNTSMSVPISGFLAVPQMISVPSPRTVACTKIQGATLHTLSLTRSGQTGWQISIIGDRPMINIALPQVPAGYNDPLSGSATLNAGALKMFDIDLNNASGLDYGEHTSAISSNSGTVTF